MPLHFVSDVLRQPTGLVTHVDSALRPLRVSSRNTEEMRPDRRSNQGGRNWETDPI